MTARKRNGWRWAWVGIPIVLCLCRSASVASGDMINTTKLVLYAVSDTVRLPTDPVERQLILDSLLNAQDSTGALTVPGGEQDSTLRRVIDSLWAQAQHDTVATDSTEAPPRAFHPPYWIGPADVASPDSLVLGLPIHRPDLTAGDDIADVMQYHGAFDILDEAGPGEDRPMLTWGLRGARNQWIIDGRDESYQRLSFPQRADFDAATVPPYVFANSDISHDGWGLQTIRLSRPNDWPLEAQSRFFVRLGSYGESSALGTFRQRGHNGRALRLDFSSIRMDGPFAFDARRNRFVDLTVVTPLKDKWFATAGFDQFRDQTTILTPSRFSGLAPTRDDMTSSVTAAVYRAPTDSTQLYNPWRIESGYRWTKQDIRANLPTYRVESVRKTYELLAEHIRPEIAATGRLIYEDLEIGDADVSRLRYEIVSTRSDTIGRVRLTESVRLDGAEHDAIAIGGRLSVAIGNPDGAGAISLARFRNLPTLFDRDRPDFAIPISSTEGVVSYSESGDASVMPEWSNCVSLEGRRRGLPWESLTWNVAAYYAHIERYLRWDDAGETSSIMAWRPVASDVSSYGGAIGWQAYWPSALLEFFGNYTYKKAEEGSTGVRLPEYFDHKAVLGLNWTCPIEKWEVKLNFRPVVMVFRPDPAIDPVPDYATVWVYRTDAIGRAEFGLLSIHFMIHNVFNYAYRTRAGYSTTGRTIRWGFDWRFLN